MNLDSRPFVRRLASADVPAAAGLRHAAFFADGKRSLDEDVAGLFDLLGGDGYEAAFVADGGGRPVGTCLFVREEIGSLHDLSPWLAGLVVARPFLGAWPRLVRSSSMRRRSAAARCISIRTRPSRSIAPGMAGGRAHERGRRSAGLDGQGGRAAHAVTGRPSPLRSGEPFLRKRRSSSAPPPAGRPRPRSCRGPATRGCTGRRPRRRGARSAP